MEIPTSKIIYPPMPIEVARRIVDGSSTIVDTLAVAEWIKQALEAIDEGEPIFSSDFAGGINDTLDEFTEKFAERHPESRVVAVGFTDVGDEVASSGVQYGYTTADSSQILAELLGQCYKVALMLNLEDCSASINGAMQDLYEDEPEDN
jgi:hypothetical protein